MYHLYANMHHFWLPDAKFKRLFQKEDILMKRIHGIAGGWTGNL